MSDPLVVPGAPGVPGAEPALPVERDPYACQRCNCHHHTTEQHDDPPGETEWWHDY